MSDPLRTDPSRTGELVSDADREAKIEQLLIAGLDHYLSARYEDAINVWTRVLFLDRSHARARAYIDRSRSALAERQRESEEMLQDGVAAFDRGEAEEARRLVQAAMSHGAPTDEALAVLDRLNRLDRGASLRVAEPVAKPQPAQRATADRQVPSSRAALAALVCLALVIVSAAAFGAGVFRSDWRALLDRPLTSPSAAPVRPAHDLQPSLPRRGETALGRARELVLAGRLRDALAALDQVAATDPQKTDADALRSDIQRQLIGLAAIARPAAVKPVVASASGDTPSP